MDALEVARFALDVAFKATALLALTTAVLAAARRSSPATRHLVAVAGLAGALAIGPLAAALPRWELAVLPPAVRAIEHAGAPAMEWDAAGGAGSAIDPASDPAAGLSRLRPGAVVVGRTLLIAWVALSWLAVAALLLSRLGVGLARVRRHLSRATPLFGAEWSAPFVRASRALGLSRFVRLAASDEVEIAMTTGELSPVVLLPPESESWPAERRRIVLLHELAHVRRHDWLSQLVCEVSLALWWFHPLAWLAARNVRSDAEQAADDLVVSCGERPSVYAHHLLEIVRSLRSGREAALVAMPIARRSGFERRVRALLDAKTHGPPSFWGRASAAAVCAAGIAIAAVHPVEANGTCPDSARARATDPTVRAEAKLGAPTWFSRAFELHSRGRYVEAIAAFEKALDRGERQAASSYNIACAYARMGEKERAFEWLDKSIEAGFSMADLAQRDGDLASLRDDPRFADFQRRVREQQLASPSDKAAHVVARFEAFAARAPSAPEGWFAMGTELARAGDYDRAARAFREAAARTDKPAGALYNAACALAHARRTAEALSELQRAVEAGFDAPRLMRSDPELENVRGDPRFEELVRMADELAFPSHATESRWREAAERFEAYGKAHPSVARAFFNAGLARLFAGEPSAATPDFTRALDLGYRESVTLYNLACAEARQGHKDRAFALLTQAMDAGFDWSALLRRDSDLDNLRGDPRFRDAIRRAAELERRRVEG